MRTPMRLPSFEALANFVELYEDEHGCSSETG
jgi:hypothetical protein